MLVPRIFLCFDAEDPYNYMDRVRKAFVYRIYADSLIKLGFYVKSMPIEHLSTIGEDQKKKIYALVHRIKRFSKEDLEELFMETKIEHSHTMNSIILRKYLAEMKEDIIPHDLILPPAQPRRLPPYFGLLELEAQRGGKSITVQESEVAVEEPRSFVQTFQEFCERSLLTSREVIATLEAIKG